MKKNLISFLSKKLVDYLSIILVGISFVGRIIRADSFGVVLGVTLGTFSVIYILYWIAKKTLTTNITRDAKRININFALVVYSIIQIGIGIIVY